MALTNDQLLIRIKALESAVNDLQTALNLLATKKQMKSLLNIRQTEIEDLKTRVTTLEGQVQVLQT